MVELRANLHNNFELSRFAFFHRWEITRNWWSRLVRDNLPTVAEYGDSSLTISLSLSDRRSKRRMVKTIGGGVEYGKSMGRV